MVRTFREPLKENPGTHNGHDHATDVFSSGEECSHDQDDDGDWNGSNSKRKFEAASVDDNDHELHGKAEKEEEIELQERDIDLVRQVPSFQAEIC